MQHDSKETLKIMPTYISQIPIKDTACLFVAVLKSERTELRIKLCDKLSSHRCPTLGNVYED